MITRSPKLAAVFDRVTRLAPARLPVLITGPTGSGKELIARAFHVRSGVEGPFVAVNCGALSASLVEAELFGHLRGAFTGAAADKVGLFEAAHGGTLLLDEIGELPLELQPRLLRVLETRAVRRVGDTEERRVDVRVVAATHRDLQAMVWAGRFREDLLHRLRILSVDLPSLAERREDIPLLVEHFLKSADPSAPALTPEAMKRMLLHGWPGNVRELWNVIVRAALLAAGAPIQPDHLELPEARRLALVPEPPSQLRLRDLTLEEQRHLLLDTLRACQNNRSRAARRLGISRSTLHERLRRLGA